MADEQGSPHEPPAGVEEAAQPLSTADLAAKFSLESGGDTAAIQVVCRFRPFNDREKSLGISEGEPIFKIGDSWIKLKDAAGNESKFDVNVGFGMESTQEEVYAVVAQKAMQDLFMGYNATIFAYGQTGAGKSWSMFGSLKDLNLRGLIPRCTETIFHTIKSGAVRGSTLTISCSYIEIYQEIVTDLLRPSKTNLQLREDPTKGVYVQDLSSEYVGSVVDVYSLIALGDVSKRRAATKMNPNSSRSHCCFTITVEQTNAQGEKSKAQLNLVDLAGSERISKTQAAGQSLEEAKKINLSLTALAQVINALAEGSKFVPYRTSKLTRLLQNSLGGNSKTSMVVACSPHPDNYEETTSSLRFAQRCACVKNKVSRNTLLSAEELQAMLEQAQQQIAKASGGKVHTQPTRDIATQTEDDGEMMTAVGGSGMTCEQLSEMEVLQARIKEQEMAQNDLKTQLDEKQLEIDVLSQRLVQSNQKVLSLDTKLQEARVAAAASASQPVAPAPGGPVPLLVTPKPQQPSLSQAKGKGRQSMFNVGFNKGRRESDLVREERTTRIADMKKRMSRLRILSSTPRGENPGPIVIPLSNNNLQPPQSAGGSAFRNIVRRLSGTPKVPEGLSPSTEVDRGLHTIHSPTADSDGDEPTTQPKASLPASPTVNEDDGNPTTSPKSPTHDTFGEDETKLTQLKAATSVEESRLEVLKMLTEVETLKQDKIRLAGQCESQDSVISRQQARMKALQEDIRRLEAERAELEDRADGAEREANELRDKLMRRKGSHLVGSGPVDDGGANIVVPVQQDSVLGALRDQEAFGQLGDLMNIFSFGFGGGQKDGEPASPGVANRFSNMFNPIGLFGGGGGGDAAEPSDQPDQTKGDNPLPDSGSFRKLKFWD